MSSCKSWRESRPSHLPPQSCKVTSLLPTRTSSLQGLHVGLEKSMSCSGSSWWRDLSRCAAPSRPCVSGLELLCLHPLPVSRVGLCTTGGRGGRRGSGESVVTFMTLCCLHFIIIIINLFTLFSPGNKTKQNKTKLTFRKSRKYQTGQQAQDVFTWLFICDRKNSLLVGVKRGQRRGS